MAAALDFRPTIDRSWLEGAFRSDPIAHAYALWDLEREPGRVRFVSAVSGDRTQGYLLIWGGSRGFPVVHWVGPVEPLRGIEGHLPPRPLIVVSPPEAIDVVGPARGPAAPVNVLVESAPLGARPDGGPRAAGVRRLVRSDLPEIEGLARRSGDQFGMGYLGLDPAAEAAFGGFVDEHLVAVARATVRLPGVWLIGGVYVEPAAREQGWGRAVTAAVMAEAAEAPAPCSLYVREDRPAARAVYRRLGFQTTGRRVWIDAGAGWSP